MTAMADLYEAPGAAVEITRRQADVMDVLETIASPGEVAQTRDLYSRLAERWGMELDRARGIACSYLTNQLQDEDLVEDHGYGRWSSTGKPWTSVENLPPSQNGDRDRVHDPDQTIEDLVDLRDKVLRTLRAHPWIQVDRLADLTHAEENVTLDALEQLLDEDLVEQDGHDRWALEGAKPAPVKPYGPRPLTDSAKELLAIVHDTPWQPASTYAEAKDVHRNGAYSQLDRLTDRGRLQMTVKDGVKHWGPADQTPPEGHMAMQAGAKSPIRQALRERIVNLLSLEPWQTRRTIAEQLDANAKSVGTRLRIMLGKDDLQRQEVTYRGDRSVYAWALPSQTPIGDDDRARIQEEQLGRMPDHYGSTQDKVLRYLERNPWSTARQVVRYHKGLNMGQVQSALATLRDRQQVVRVADGEYRYALPGTELTRNVSGRLEHGGKGSDQLDAALEALTGNGGMATPDLQDAVEQILERGCTGLSQQLNKAHRRGILGKRKATRGSGRGKYAVTEWWIEERPTPDPADVLGHLERHAAQLRNQGWTVMIDAQPPDDQERGNQ